jgi:lipopolysaccharide cholinephosphotransferase
MIDPKIQAELRAKYNPDGSPMRELQLRTLDILKYIDELCQKHDIKYWLSSGNCIGLVRHGGFIPWDYDVDVEMLREDYLKFEKVFKETDDFLLHSRKNDDAYISPFSKIRDKNSYLEESSELDVLYKYKGIYVDLLQLEYSHRSVCRFTINCRYFITKFLIKRKANIFIIKLFKYALYCLIAICRFFCMFLPGKKLRHTYGVGWLDKIREPQDIFPLKRAFFEGVEVNIPNNIDRYLTRIYGDYMKLPSEDEINQSFAHVKKLKFFDGSNNLVK